MSTQKKNKDVVAYCRRMIQLLDTNEGCEALKTGKVVASPYWSDDTTHQLCLDFY